MTPVFHKKGVQIIITNRCLTEILNLTYNHESIAKLIIIIKLYNNYVWIFTCQDQKVGNALLLQL